MVKSAFQRLSIYINISRIKILDAFAPITSWILLIFYRKYWVSFLAQKIVGNWETPTRKRQRIVDQWNNIHQPENWFRAVILAVGLIFIPQLLATFWFISPFFHRASEYGWKDNNSASVLGTTWQVTAGLIGITFVIVIFLVEYANSGKYEQRALPVFFAETWMLFTSSFGILVILSTGITALFLATYKLRTDYLSFLYYWHWVLFIVNTILILNIFVRTVRVLRRSYFITKLKEFNHRIAARLVVLELIDRVARNKSDQLIKALGISFPYFEPTPLPGKVFVSVPNLPRQIQRVTDINLKLVEIAYRNAQQLYPSIQEADFVFYAKLDHRIASERPAIALINPVINHPSVTSYLKRSIQVKSFKRAERSRLTE
jgi:hypothetical protein